MSRLIWPGCTVSGCSHGASWPTDEDMRIAGERYGPDWVGSDHPYVGQAVCMCHSWGTAAAHGVVERFTCDQAKNGHVFTVYGKAEGDPRGHYSEEVDVVVPKRSVTAALRAGQRDFDADGIAVRAIRTKYRGQPVGGVVVLF